MSEYVPTPTAKPIPDRKWTQESSKRFASYDEAKAHFETLPMFKEIDDGKKRIRARKSGHFDVLLFKPVPKPKREKTEAPK